LLNWSAWFETSKAGIPIFPWDDFHLKGITLAKELNRLLQGNPPVYYAPPFEDPSRRDMADVFIG